MSKVVRVCLVGASGLTGSALIEQSLTRPDLRLVAVSRRELALPYGARMEVLLADTPGWDDAIAATNASVLVCALGTTWKKAGKSEAAFRAVDHDLVLQCARAAMAAGIDHMIVVSSTQADSGSKWFYQRVKGETETALARMRFRRLDVVRPGLLTGPRAEFRPAERIASWLFPVINLFLQGKWRRYRSISADTVARAICALVREKAGGHFVHEHDAIHYAIRRSHRQAQPADNIFRPA